MKKSIYLIASVLAISCSCSKYELPGDDLGPDPELRAKNSSSAYWDDIKGKYNNDVCFLIDHDLLYPANPKLENLVDSVETADGISIDRATISATILEIGSGDTVLHVENIYSKHTNVNRLIHNVHQQYSQGLLSGNHADFILLFHDAAGHAITSSEHPDNIMRLSFAHLKNGIIY